jgi:hypothetical protein
MVECLLLQGQSLRSNPSATKKRQDTGHISLDQCLSQKAAVWGTGENHRENIKIKNHVNRSSNL